MSSPLTKKLPDTVLHSKPRRPCKHGLNERTKRCKKGTPVRKKSCVHGESTVDKTKSGMMRCNKKTKTIKVALTKTTTRSKSIGIKGIKLQPDEFLCRTKKHNHDSSGRVIAKLNTSSYTLKNGRYTLYAYCPENRTTVLHKPTTLEFITVNDIKVAN